MFLLAFPFFAFVSDFAQTNIGSSKKSSIGVNLRIKVGKSPGSVEAADFNNDNFPDLAVTSELDSSVTVLLGNGKGSFTEAAGSPFFAGPIPNDISIKDFNKDGTMDLAFANHEQKYLTVLLNN